MGVFKSIRSGFRIIRQFIIDIRESQKNIKEFRQTVRLDEIRDILQIRIDPNEVINVICRVNEYEYSFNDSKVRKTTTFNVHCEYPPDLPDDIESIFKITLTIPKLINGRASMVIHSRIAIEAYISLLHSRATHLLPSELNLIRQPQI